MRFSAHGAFLEGEMVSEEAKCGELLRQRALLGAEAICSQEFPPAAEYASFLPEWKQSKGREGEGKQEEEIAGSSRGEWGKNSP